MSSVAPPSDVSLSNYYKRIVSDLEDELRNDARKNRESAREITKAIEQKYTEDLVKKEEASNEAVRRITENANKAYDREKVGHQNELDKLKNQAYNNKGQLLTVPLDVHKKQVDELMANKEKTKQKDAKTLANMTDEYRHRLDETNRDHTNQIHKMVEQQSFETKDLEEQIKDLSTYNKKLDKEHSKGLEDLVQDYNNSLKSEARRLEDSYNANVDKLNESIRQKEDYYARTNKEALKEKETYFADVIRNQNEDHQRELKVLQDTFNTQINRLEDARKKDQKDSDEVLHNQLNNAHQQETIALQNQAKAYEQEIDRQNRSDSEKIQTLEKSLQTQRTSQDSTLVSPAVEASIRKGVVTEYERSLNAEVERNKLQQDAVQRKYADDYQEALESFEDKTTTNLRENERNRTLERNQLLSTIQDAEYQANAKVREQEASHERERESLYKQFGALMERQRREYEHIIESIRSDADSKLGTIRFESENNSRVAQRDFNARQNELIRDYEKKIGDQKRVYEAQIEDLKVQAQVDQRDFERKAKSEMESQAKGYELRLAQGEAQSKERERSIAQSYQDELDRTRHSYELLAKKKS